MWSSAILTCPIQNKTKHTKTPMCETAGGSLRDYSKYSGGGKGATVQGCRCLPCIQLSLLPSLIPLSTGSDSWKQTGVGPDLCWVCSTLRSALQADEMISVWEWPYWLPKPSPMPSQSPSHFQLKKEAGEGWARRCQSREQAQTNADRGDDQSQPHRFLFLARPLYKSSGKKLQGLKEAKVWNLPLRPLIQG